MTTDPTSPSPDRGVTAAAIPMSADDYVCRHGKTLDEHSCDDHRDHRWQMVAAAQAMSANDETAKTPDTRDDGLRDALRGLADEFALREEDAHHAADSYYEGQRDAWDVAESKIRALLTEDGTR